MLAYTRTTAGHVYADALTNVRETIVNRTINGRSHSYEIIDQTVDAEIKCTAHYQFGTPITAIFRFDAKTQIWTCVDGYGVAHLVGEQSGSIYQDDKCVGRYTKPPCWCLYLGSSRP